MRAQLAGALGLGGLRVGLRQRTGGSVRWPGAPSPAAMRIVT